jgi:hypothetical protein
LAKRHDTFGPLQGSDNWLSDNMQQNQLKVLRDAKIKADTDAAAAAKTAADEKSKQSTTAQTTSEFNDMSNPLLPPTG